MEARVGRMQHASGIPAEISDSGAKALGSVPKGEQYCLRARQSSVFAEQLPSSADDAMGVGQVGAAGYLTMDRTGVSRGGADVINAVGISAGVGGGSDFDEPACARCDPAAGCGARPKARTISGIGARGGSVSGYLECGAFS